MLYSIVSIYISNNSYFIYFIVQDSLTILCYQFPLISSINDSSLQCARLRLDDTISSSDFDFNNPSQLSLFIIIDQLSSISPINININFNQTFENSLSSINEIYLSLLVVHSNYTVNNQTTIIYSSNDILILYWNNLQPDLYDPIDSIHLNDDEYETDKSMCRWNNNRWNRLFNINSSFGYFLKTTNTDLIFIINTTQPTSLLSPYLNILYCIPYKLGITELIILICSAIFFLLFLLTLGIFRYYKVVDNLTGHSQQHSSYINSSMTLTDDLRRSNETELIN